MVKFVVLNVWITTCVSNRLVLVNKIHQVLIARLKGNEKEGNIFVQIFCLWQFDLAI